MDLRFTFVEKLIAMIAEQVETKTIQKPVAKLSTPVEDKQVSGGIKLTKGLMLYSLALVAVIAWAFWTISTLSGITLQVLAASAILSSILLFRIMEDQSSNQ